MFLFDASLGPAPPPPLFWTCCSDEEGLLGGSMLAFLLEALLGTFSSGDEGVGRSSPALLSMVVPLLLLLLLLLPLPLFPGAITLLFIFEVDDGTAALRGEGAAAGARLAICALGERGVPVLYVMTPAGSALAWLCPWRSSRRWDGKKGWSSCVVLFCPVLCCPVLCCFPPSLSVVFGRRPKRG